MLLFIHGLNVCFCIACKFSLSSLWFPKLELSNPSLYFQLEKICEDTVVADKKQNLLSEFIPSLRSGEWSDIGHRSYMEDTHICIADLAKKFGYPFGKEAISFYGVSPF